MEATYFPDVMRNPDLRAAASKATQISEEALVMRAAATTGLGGACFISVVERVGWKKALMLMALKAKVPTCSRVWLSNTTAAVARRMASNAIHRMAIMFMSPEEVDERSLPLYGEMAILMISGLSTRSRTHRFSDLPFRTVQVAAANSVTENKAFSLALGVSLATPTCLQLVVEHAEAPAAVMAWLQPCP